MPLIRLSDDCGDATNSFLLEDSNSISDDDKKNVGWPFVECVVSIIKKTLIFFFFLIVKI